MPMSGYGKLGAALSPANLADLRRAQALERGRALVRIGRRHSRIVGDGRRHVELRFWPRLGRLLARRGGRDRCDRRNGQARLPNSTGLSGAAPSPGDSASGASTSSGFFGSGVSFTGAATFNAGGGSGGSWLSSIISVVVAAPDGIDRRLPLEGIDGAGDRRDRQPAVGDIAVGDPGAVARRAHGAGEPFALASLVATRRPRCAPSTCRCAPTAGRRDRARAPSRASCHSCASIAATGDGDLAFDVARREARQMLDPLQPLARRLAGLGEGIDESEVGMRRRASRCGR